MGNHDVGRAMHAAAKACWAAAALHGAPPPSQEEALQILDIMAEDFRGADAEFDDYDQPDEPLGRLIAIAFGGWTEEDKAKDAEMDGEHWYEDRRRPFSDRYGFC